MSQQYDVIVAGAGPAGSISAYHLVKKGFDVLIIDKAKFPRYKVCGGGLPFKAQELLPFDVSHLLESEIYNFIFSCKYDTIYKRQSDKMLIECYMREDLDNFFIEQAVDAGAVFHDGEKIKEIVESNQGVIVKTENAVYNCRLLVGADGANSIVAKSLNLMQKNVSKAYAIESEIFVDDKTYDKYRQTVGLDWGTLTNGYGWIFPKKNHLSVGVGAPISSAKLVRFYYDKLLKRLGIEVKETRSLSGHTIPFRAKHNKIYSDSVVLAGDAAGLTDPLTGEGIYYALKSGIIASETISDYLNGIIIDLSSYQKRVDDEIMTELNAALPIQYIFNIAPLYFHNMLRDNDRLWSAFCRILRGELSYTVIKSKLPASDLIWKPLVASAKIMNNIKVKRG